ncbi:alkaline phosphatase family protein, partial [Sphingopyxis sp. RIFCSPHIGHO2_12_FULL_65_19]|uniref:alkaline phosphatase family protein n=1 Tax=Sphingopyxis sp. RIFCSPHIGHO2_12_FULL_65_19 TaxID=1802172 RepID=UPI000B323EB4
MNRFVPFLLALFLPFAALAQEGDARAPVTILISIDGFRADYLDRGITPNLSRLAADGAHGKLRPSFPTKTFPNHYAMVTGKRPDN